MQDTVFGVLYEARNKVFLEDAFRSKEEAEQRAATLRRKRTRAWVEPLDRSVINPKLWTNYGEHPLR